MFAAAKIVAKYGNQLIIAVDDLIIENNRIIVVDMKIIIFLCNSFDEEIIISQLLVIVYLINTFPN